MFKGASAHEMSFRKLELVEPELAWGIYDGKSAPLLCNQG